MKKTLLHSILLGAMMLLTLPAWAKTYTVKFTNDFAWGQVYTWIWNNQGDNLSSAWPGEEMLPDGTGRYVLNFTWDNEPAYIIFSDGVGTQTPDLEFVNNGVYNFDGLVEVETVWAGTATFNLGAYPGISSPEGFFTYDTGGKWNFNAKYTDAEYDGIQFTSGLKIEATTKIFFTTPEVTTITNKTI